MSDWKKILLIGSCYIMCVLLYQFYFSSTTSPADSTNSSAQNISSIIASDSHPKYLSARIQPKGRLGNNIFDIVSIYGLSKSLNRTPVIWIEDESYRRMLNYTGGILPGLVSRLMVLEKKLPAHANTVKFHNKSRVFEDPERLKNITDDYLHLNGLFYQSWKYFERRQEEIKSYLRPQKKFAILPETDERNFITCIHTRRTDFLKIGWSASNPVFIRKAVEFIESREKNKSLNRKRAIFGDDIGFMMNIFPDSVLSNATSSDVKNTTVNFVSANSRSDDLLYSSQHCDSVLISAPVSTFGWWFGYLSKSNNVFYVDVTTVRDKFYESGRLNTDDYFLPKWTALRMSADNETVIETPSVTVTKL